MNIIKKEQLLPLVAKYLPSNPVIIEAGAFNGSDTKRLAEFWPMGTIHAFEPVPNIFQLLTENTANYSNVHRHNYALSSHDGQALFYVSEKPSRPGKPFQAGSLHKPKERLNLSDARYPHQITVPTVTLDTWAREHNVAHIDFLWLDAQGHELEIVKAAPNMLSTVRALWMEVQFIDAYHNQPRYPEVAQWIEAQGFSIVAQDFKNETDWFFGNILCLRRP